MAIPNMWRTKKQRYSLQGGVCQHCERAVFPPREICPHCHRPMQTTAITMAPVFDFAALMTPAAAQSAAMVGDD
ncbi:MAG TPA: hypothetical protein GX400_07890 [Chloroflexi bacterium]|nr:hypothetical protein [Chloroflexota bacterium]